jgi:hypothetical protein
MISTMTHELFVQDRLVTANIYSFYRWTQYARNAVPDHAGRLESRVCVLKNGK